MKFRRTPKFNEDFKDLSPQDQEEVKAAFPNVALALQGNAGLFRKHRIKQMQGHEEIWEGHVKINYVSHSIMTRLKMGKRFAFFGV